VLESEAAGAQMDLIRESCAKEEVERAVHEEGLEDKNAGEKKLLARWWC
jgi:hypothetical protein